MKTSCGRRRRALAGLALILLCCALVAACAGQKLEVKPRGQAIFGLGTGSR